MARALPDDAPTHRAMRRRRPSAPPPPPRAAGEPAGAVEVRTATLRDLETVTRLRLALQQEELQLEPRASPGAPSPAAARARFATQLQSADETTFLAVTRLRRRAVGVLRCTVSRPAAEGRRPPYAFLASAYVAPAHRGRGILRTLLGAADRWCEARGLEEMRLHCLLNNRVATAAWERLGFTSVDVVRRAASPRPAGS